MKRISSGLSVLFVLAAVLVSCEKDSMNKQEYAQQNSSDFLKAATVISSEPISDAGIVPVIIPGKNKGGNRTCEEVAATLNTSFDLCTNRINYLGKNLFDSPFPDGLNISMDGNFLSFSLNGGFITIGDASYVVGAVIIKGSNQANVYYYPEGISADAGLAAPSAAHMISNVTFCLVKTEELVVTAKCRLWYNDELRWAVSSGEKVFNVEWCGEWYLGVNEYPSVTKFDLHLAGLMDEKVGEVTVENGLITVKLNDGFVLEDTWIYVGELHDLLTENLYNGCPFYTNVPPWMYDDSNTNSVSFSF